MRENVKEREEGGVVVSCGSRRKYRCEGLMSEEAGTGQVSAVVLSFLKRCRHLRRLGCPLPLPFAFFFILPPSMSFPATSIASLCSERSRLSCPVPRGYLFNIVTRQQRKGEKGERREEEVLGVPLTTVASREIDDSTRRGDDVD